MWGNLRAESEPRNDIVNDDLEALFRVEYEPMHRLAYAILGSDGTAEEVVQDAFLVVAARWASLENPGGYLRVSVVNGAKKKLRARSNRQRTERRAAISSIGEAVASPTYLLDVLDSLPDRQRVAVVLTYYSGLSSREASEVMGCPAATVRSHLRRALKQLAEVVEQ